MSIWAKAFRLKSTKSRYLNAKKESGNVFLMLFGAVALVGVIGASTMTIMRGPVQTMSQVTKRTLAENNAITTARIAVVTASQDTSFDCDTDNFIEPEEFDIPISGTGGGTIPLNIGVARQDPWGNEYLYCVWDHGSDSDASCGSKTNYRVGGDVTSEYVLAIISGGSNGVFETTCNDYVDSDGDLIADIPLLETAPGSDDITFGYTYNDAVDIAGGLWTDDGFGGAEIDRSLAVRDSGGVERFSFDLAAETLRIGDGVTGTGEFPVVRTDNIQPITTGGPIDILSNTEITGNLTVSGDISGDDLIGATLNITNDANFGNDVDVAGDLTVAGTIDLNNLEVDGNTILGDGSGADTTIINSQTTISSGYDLTVAGGNITLSGGDVNVTGDVNAVDGDFSGTLDVAGNTNLSTLNTSGLSTLESLTVTNLSDLQGDVNLGSGPADIINLLGSLTINADLDMNGNRIIDLANPINNQDATTKIYVDNEISAVTGANETDPQVVEILTDAALCTGNDAGRDFINCDLVGAASNDIAAWNGTEWISLASTALPVTESDPQVDDTLVTQALCVAVTGSTVDCNLTAPAANHVAYWNGTGWVALDATTLISGVSNRLQDDDGDTFIDPETGVSDDDILRFGTNTFERMRILSTGEIGIGDVTPTSALDIIGTQADASYAFSVQNTTADGELLQALNSNGNQIMLLNQTVTGDSAFQLLRDDGSINMFVTNTGATVFGDAAVSGTLLVDIEGQVGATEYCDEDGLNCFDYEDVTAGTARELIDTDLDTGVNVDTATDGSADTIVFTNDGAISALIDITGNFGIGDETPDATLEISADGVTTGTAFMVSRDDANDGDIFSILEIGTVGIGINTPQSTLHVNTENPGSILQLANGISMGTTASDGLIISVDGLDNFTINNQENTDLIFHTNALESMRITAAGDVGIGDPTPDLTLLLDVEGQIGATEYCDQDGLNCFDYTDVTAGTARELIDTDLDTGVNVDTAGDGSNNTIIFTNASTESARFDAAGNLGIGITIPTATLDVVGTFNVTTTATVGTDLTVTNDATVGNDLTVTNNAGVTGNLSVTGTSTLTDDLAVDTTDLFVDVSTNQVGIGTNAPDASTILDINTTTAGILGPRLTTLEKLAIANPATGLFVFDTDSGVYEYNAGTPGVPDWQPLTPAGASIGDRIQDIGNDTFIDVDTTNDGLTNEIVFNNNGAEAMRIDAAGNLGIGDDTPDAHLEISANGTAGGPALLVSSNDASDGDLLTILENGSIGVGINAPAEFFQINRSGVGSNLLLTNTDIGSTATDGMDIGFDGTFNAFINNQENTDLIVSTNSTEAMRITAAGSVGIGTAAPDASALLDINTTTAGILGPRLTTLEKLAIVNPATGLFVFDTDTGIYEYNAGTPGVPDWQPFTPAGVSIGDRIQDANNDTFIDVDTTNDGLTNDIVFNNNGAESVRVTSGNDLVIGDTAASLTLMLDVAGQIGAAEYCDEDGLNCSIPEDLGLWTENTTHITRENFHVIDTASNPTAAGLDGDGYRAFYQPFKGAFRGGEIEFANDAWQDANVGFRSFAWGRNIQASGSNSVALGNSSTADGFTSFAFGENSVAGNNYSIAMGLAASSSADSAIALGNNVTASGQNSTALGLGVDVTGERSFAIGLGDPLLPLPILSANESMAIFFGDQNGEDITATNVLALEGGSLLLSNDSGTPCVAAKQGALRLSATGDSLEICDFASPPNDWRPLTAAASGTGDRIQDIGNDTFIDVDTTNDGLTNDIVFNTNGAETMRLTSTGILNFGVGIAGGRINISGASADDALWFNDGQARLWSDGAGTLRFGFGDNTPRHRMTLSGFASSTNNGFLISNTNQVTFASSNVDTDTGLGRTTGGTADFLGLYTGNVEALTIDDAQRVGIGTALPNDSALLDVSTTTRGILGPRMTTLEKNAIVTPATGLYVFDTDLNLYQYNAGTPGAPDWQNLTPPGASSFWIDNLTYITRENFNIIDTGQTSTSTGLDGGGGAIDGTFYDPNKFAFRGGQITGTEDAWQDANIGNASFAWGVNTEASGDQSTVAGGQGNTASGTSSFIGGGTNNDATGATTFIGGGDANSALGTVSTVAGGSDNAASNYGSFIGAGDGNTASGSTSVIAGGEDNTASGNTSSIIGGFGNEATGNLSTVAGGFSNTASGERSLVGGSRNTATGFSSTAFGTEVQVGTGVAQTTDANPDVGNYSVGFGLGDASTGTLPQITGNETMAIFFGDQESEDITATNVLALEGGSLLLSNDSGTDCAADKTGALRLNALGDGLEMCNGTPGGWNQFPSPGATSFWTDNGTHITRENFHIIDTGETSTTAGLDGDGTYSFYDPNKGAFRGGVIAFGNDAWQDANVGFPSFAFGQNVEASDQYTAAIGVGNTASSFAAIALGSANVASGNSSFASGNSNTSSGSSSTTLGWGGTASGDYSTTIGRSNTATGDYATGLGRSTRASGFNSTAFGREVQVGTGVAQSDDTTADVGNYSVGFGLGDSSVGDVPQITSNQTAAFFFGDQESSEVSDENSLALVGGKLLIDQVDNGVDTDYGCIRYNDTANQLEFSNNCDSGTPTYTAFGSGGVSELNDLSDAATDYVTDNNMFIGQGAGGSIVAGGMRNLALGINAGASITNTEANTFIGFQSGQNANTTDAYRNTLLGAFTGQDPALGFQNTLIGERAGRDLTGNDNTLVGRAAGQNLTAGNRNIILGVQDELSPFTTGDDNIIIGNFNQPAVASASNQLNIGDLIYGDLANKYLMVGDTPTFMTFGGGTDPKYQFLSDDGTSDFVLGQVGTGSSSSRADLVFVRGGGSPTAPTTVTAGDIVGGIRFAGHDGTDFTHKASIIGRVDGAVSTNVVPTALIFNTSNTALTGDNSERMRITSAGNIGIGTTAPDASAILDITSTTAGLLPPRMTTLDRDAINGSTFADGLMIFNEDTDNMEFWDGTTWISMDSTTGGSVSELDDLTDAATDYVTDFDMSIGLNAGTAGSPGIRNLAIGQNALNSQDLVCAGASDCDVNLAIGYDALTNLTTGDQNLAIGNEALLNATIGSENLAIGGGALRDMIDGNANVAIGDDALEQATTGNGNIAIGDDAIRTSLNPGNNNIAIGQNALLSNTGSRNIGIGSNTLDVNTGNGNVAVGIGSMGDNSTGVFNTAVGDRSMQEFLGDENVAFGHDALAGQDTLSTGSRNTALGFQAGEDITTGNSNTLVGHEAAPFLTEGTGNVILGAGDGGSDNGGIGETLLTGDNNILIGGPTVDVPTASTSDYLNIGDLIYGDLANTTFLVGEPTFETFESSSPAYQFFKDAPNSDLVIGSAGGSPPVKPDIDLFRSRGTVASQLAVEANDHLGGIRFSGFDGTQYSTKAQINAIVDGTVSTDIVPTAITFSTSDDTDAALDTSKERIRITSSGNVGIGAWNTDTVESALHLQDGELRFDGGAANEAGCIRFDDATDQLEWSNDCTTYNPFGGGSSGAGGNDTEVQFNNAGALDGDAEFTYDSTNDTLSVTGTVEADERVSLGLTTGGAAPTFINNNGPFDWSEFVDAMELDATTTIDMDTNAANLIFDNTDNVLVLDSVNNRVGIGTNAPSQMLHIYDNSATTPPTFLIENDGDDHVDAIFDANRASAFNDLTNINFNWDGNWVAGIRVLAGSDDTNKDEGIIQFRTREDGQPSPDIRLVIRDDGDIGFRDNTPDAKFEISAEGDTTGALMYLSSFDNADGDIMTVLESGNVGIGTATPEASALLDVTSTTLGILGPRMTTAQKNAITTPATGLYVFDTDLNRYQYNSGTPGAPVWSDFVTGGGGGTPGGADTQVQFNNSGAFDGDAEFTYDSTNDILTVDGTVQANTSVILGLTGGAAAPTYSSGGGGSSLFTDNTTHITRENFHIINTGETPNTAGLNFLTGGTGAFFYPDKNSFRGGEIGLAGGNNDAWQDANIGDNSFGYGYNVEVSAETSAAFGDRNTVSAQDSFAVGVLNTVSGIGSFASGASSTASGSYSNVLGFQNTASGSRSVASGSNNTASGAVSTAVGANAEASGWRSVAIGNGVRAGTGTAQTLNGFATDQGNFSIGFGLGDPSTATLPQVTSNNTAAFFFNDQESSNVDEENTLALVGGKLMIDAVDNGTDTEYGCIRYNDTANQLEWSNNCEATTPTYTAFGVGAASDRLQDIGNDTFIDVDTTNDGATDTISFATNGTERFIINSSGDIEIGSSVTKGDATTSTSGFSIESTSAPSFTRDFSGGVPNSRSLLLLERTNATGAGADGIGGHIDFYAETETEGDIQFLGQLSMTATDATAGTIDSRIALTNRIDGTSSERLVIEADGTIGMNTSAPDASAALDITSTIGGLLPPRVTTAERDAINTGTFADGLMVYNTTTDDMEYWDGAAWRSMDGSGGGGLWTAGAGDDIYYNTGTPQVGIGITTPQDILHIFGDNQDVILESNGPNANDGADYQIFRSRSGGIVSNDDKIGGNRFYAHDGAGFQGAAAIVADVDGTPGAGDLPTRLEFHVAQDGGIVDEATDTPEMVIKADGNVGIGTETPNEALEVVGNIQYSGFLYDASDRRLKDNITPLNSDDILSRLSQIDTYSFTMKADEEKNLELGVIAQEIESVFPELVSIGDDEMQTRHVNYVGFIAPLIEATKTLKAENETLRAEMGELKDNQEQIMKDLAEMKAMMDNPVKGAKFDPMMLIFAMMIGGVFVLVTRRTPANKEGE
ncbi:MAG: tail fiber domain-containing protein [Pseudomonadota bacterium]